MRPLLCAFVWVFSVLLLLYFSLPAAYGQGEKEEDLIGHWTFEKEMN